MSTLITAKNKAVQEEKLVQTGAVQYVHGLWRCEKFRDLSSRDRVKTVLNKKLCFKCLGGGHFKDRCPRETFKCQVQGCVEDHNTLLHPTPPTLEENPQQTNAAMGYTSATHRTNQDGQSGGRAFVTVATRGR